MKLPYLLFALFPLAALCSRANSVLWEKTLLIENAASPVVRVGHDGSVAIVDGARNARKIHWFDRQGNTIATPVPLQSDLRILLYVSKDEVVSSYWYQNELGTTSSAMELFQLNTNGQVEQKIVSASASGVSSHYLEYPYLLESTSVGNVFSYKLLDLTSSTAPTIVGDAVVGVSGKNLKVRWKSLSTAKYKVQTSVDLVTWGDHTDILDGTGATIIVNVPMDDISTTLYARVVKL